VTRPHGKGQTTALDGPQELRRCLLKVREIGSRDLGLGGLGQHAEQADQLLIP
jgi:hypothetical protein